MGNVWQYILNRLGEASTWRGFVLLLTSLGLVISEEQAVAIVTAGLGIVGLIGVFSRDRNRKERSNANY